MDKPKQKWVSSRLKDKKKELGIEDKIEENSTTIKEYKKVSKISRYKNNDNDSNRRDHSRTPYKKGSYKKGSYKKNSHKRGSDKKGSYKKYSRNKDKFVIKISNLPRDITTKELFDLVHIWGEIGNINIKNYYDSISSYIDFYNKEEAEYFIKALDSTPFDNLIIKVELMNFT